jgi:hypothetical protein
MRLDPAVMRDIERERMRSLVEADMETAGALHAEDYQLITPRGYAMSKHDYLGRIAAGRLRYRVFEPACDIAVRGCGEVALLRYQARICIAEDTEARPPSPAGTPTAMSCGTRAGRRSGRKPP